MKAKKPTRKELLDLLQGLYSDLLQGRYKVTGKPKVYGYQLHDVLIRSGRK